MKAIVSERYGPLDVLEVQEIERPGVTDGGVLVRVRATSVNAFDWHMLRGKPYFARLSEGLRRPKNHKPSATSNQATLAARSSLP